MSDTLQSIFYQKQDFTMRRILFLVAALLLLSGCADNVSLVEAAAKEEVGFWYGLWHGLIIIFAWIGSLFSDDIAIYAIYNNGGWYDFGYVLGVGGLGFGSGIFHSGSSD